MSLHYVPAGVELLSVQRGQLGVRIEHNKVEKTHFGKKYKKWETFDKTVILTTTSMVDGIHAKEPLDAIIPVFSAEFVQACGLTKILANPIHRPFYKAPFHKRGIESIVDSGGFQMLKSTVDFVHPDDVIKRYNAQANIGMPLDLPVRSAVEDQFFDPVSKMIKANDDYILKGLKDGVHLALISHGSTIKLRERRLDVLDRKAEVVAIAGLNIKPGPGVDHNLNNIENLMYVVTRYHKVTRYFHVLGMTSKLWVFMYALLSEAKFVREIGADSVSHRLGALVGMFDTPDFQSVSLAKTTSFKTIPPCNCPVCASVDDFRIIQNSVILESHNLWVRAKQTELIEELARSYIQGTVNLKTIYDTLQLKTGPAKFQYMVHYAQEVIASGKWRPIKPPRTSRTLFEHVKASVKNKGSEELRAHYAKVIARYEKFHKTKFMKG